MNEVRFVVKNGVRLRTGYTTGSCAAAAAGAAARALLTGKPVPEITITLPNGGSAAFLIHETIIRGDSAVCSVLKDAGDDPDVTDGIEIRAECRFCDVRDDGPDIRGGEGIGTVTEPGLRCAVGEAAINPVPRAMIKECVLRECERRGCVRGMSVTIAARNGAEIAKRTFNARLGIVGGISILGTTGIVEPMSESALIETIKLDMDRARRAGGNLIISPGSIGLDYCGRELGLDVKRAVKCSNFLGEALDYAVYKGFDNILLVGHAGKLVKVAGGVMNTHSSCADCRMEIIAAHAACHGADADTARRIMRAPSVDAAAQALDAAGIAPAVFASIMRRILFHIDCRVKGALNAQAIMFAGENRVMAKSAGAGSLIKLFAPPENGERDG